MFAQKFERLDVEYFNQRDIEQYHTDKKGKQINFHPIVTHESLGFNVIEEEEEDQSYSRRNA
jgi:hypothetical protein